MPKLIKDFRDYQFVYYWYEKGQGRISPLLPTLTHAEDWIILKQRESYAGLERRRRASTPTIGRRSTDAHISVDIDIAAQKITDLKQSFAA